MSANSGVAASMTATIESTCWGKTALNAILCRRHSSSGEISSAVSVVMAKLRAV